jgi:FMN hydrolase / 5-amino-6-(5-phospho-D-ribitylamino)uracil phosphatase
MASTSLPSPKLVLFDLDDTLCDHDGSLRVRLATSFAAAFNGNPPEHLDQIVEESIDVSVFGTDHFADVLKPHGVTDAGLVQAAADVYVADRYRGLELFPEAVDVVRQIGERANVGMITNGPSGIQRGKIDLLQIEPLFPFILVSEEVDIWKPDPRIFHRAMELGKAAPEETVYIGDNPGHDVAGAHAAGITSVWVNRRGMDWPGGTPPHHEIFDLRQLFEIFYFGSNA